MPTTVEVAAAHGIKIPQIAWDAAQAEGVPYFVVCALLMQETGGGLNIWGHDGGSAGWYSGAGAVTEVAYKAYKIGRQQGKGMQGVGPAQITWWTLQDAADAIGGCWIPTHNVTIGLRELKRHYTARGNWVDAARDYNGSGPMADAYAQQMATRYQTWQALLKDATQPGGTMTDDRYARVQWREQTFDKMTVAALTEVEKRLGYELTIVQGSYNGGTGAVSASAGTHDGGGAADLLPWDYARKVLVCRQVGFAAWHRPAIPGLWGEHIHVELLGDEMASAGAKAQWAQYRAGQNGLADHGPDTGPRLNPIPTFHYQPGGTVPTPAPTPTPASDPVKFPKIQDLQEKLFAARSAAVTCAAMFPNMASIEDTLSHLRHDFTAVQQINHPDAKTPPAK